MRTIFRFAWAGLPYLACLILLGACANLDTRRVEREPRRDDNHSNLIGFYKRYITPIDGERCAMYPSCSLYAREAMSERGVLLGFLLVCDRLTRCGRDLHRYPSLWLDGMEFHYDPVPPAPTAQGKEK